MFAQRKNCVKVTDSRLQLTTEVREHLHLTFSCLISIEGIARHPFDQVLRLGAILRIEGPGVASERDTRNQGNGVSFAVASPPLAS
jgi:hypothetical protein